MKKIINKINFAIIGMMLAMPAMAAANMEGVCDLIEGLKGIFQILRIMAFVGAGFFVASWAWEYISAPKDGGELIKDVKKKGTGMLVGFLLLFMIGTVLSVVLKMGGAGGSLGCVGDALMKGW